VASREATFGDDLAVSLGAWSKAPALPGLTVLLGILSEVPDHLGGPGFLLALPATVVLAGWVGTQRLWYLRLFRGMHLERQELWPFTWAFLGRYLALGFLAGIPFALVVVPVSVAVTGQVARAIVILPFVFVADFVLTFVTPALAFSTRQVSEALGIGWRTLWDGWPATAPYAVAAPLVLIGVGGLLSRTIGAGGSIAVSLVGLLLALLFKGATAAYYLRGHRVGDDGAA
jgi:hypothetical protein